MVELSFKDIGLLASIGRNPSFGYDELANEVDLSEASVRHKIYMFREHGMVVEALSDYKDMGYKWMITGKGVKEVKKNLDKTFKGFNICNLLENLENSMVVYRPK